MTSYTIKCKNRNSYLRAGIMAIILAFLFLKIMTHLIEEMGKDLFDFTSQDLAFLIGALSFEFFLWVLGFVLIHAALVLTERTITANN